MHDLNSVWPEVRKWPTRQRLELASRILQSLQVDEDTRTVSPERREALLGLIGIFKMESPPSDAEVEQIVEQERMKKHGL